MFVQCLSVTTSKWGGYRQIISDPTTHTGIIEIQQHMKEKYSKIVYRIKHELQRDDRNKTHR